MKDFTAPARLWAWGKRHLLKALVAVLAVLAWLWDWGKRHLLKALVAALVLVFLVLAGVLVAVVVSKEPGWVLSPLGFAATTQKTQGIELIGIAMGGVLLTIGAVIANRRAVAMEDAVKSTEKGLRQERLKTAIEHLGDDSDTVRLGGAYELFHLAQDNEDLRQTALDILCAHIRHTTGGSIYRERHATAPSMEVQSLLTLLFVQEHEVFRGCHIDLRGSWLNGASLSRARLQKASLSEAHLQRAHLNSAHLQRAVLNRAHLQEAHFLGACLKEARLSEVHLQGANLNSAHLQGANLIRARLQGASLIRARLQEASLSEAHLQRTHLNSAHLQEAHFVEARLQGACLSEAYLQGANLIRAYLQGAVLNRAHLQGANLIRARLQGANLNRAHLQGASLSEARLQGACLSEAYLQGANLIRAYLQGAVLNRAHLQGANLIRARLQGANLNRAHLQGASLSEAHLQGADLFEAQLQGTSLFETRLQGSTSQLDEYEPSFEERIDERIGRKSNLSGVVFAGGLGQQDLDSFVEGLSSEKAEALRQRLEPHIGQPPSCELPKGYGAITGAYTAEDAECWIAEYKKATGGVPKAGGG